MSIQHTKRTAIVWFRRDLRLTDNPALHAALASHEQIIPLYIHAPDEEAPWQPGAASNWWLHESLTQLDRELRQLGSRLFILQGSSDDCLSRTVHLYQADTVLWNRVYEPALIERDSRIKRQLKENGLTCHSFNASLLNEPHSIRNESGKPYKVFSAYWRKCQSSIYEVDQPFRKPEWIESPQPVDDVLSPENLGLLPRHSWHKSFNKHWQPGETGAQQKLSGFIRQRLPGYKTERDIPAIAGTSRLSPHLHFGEISPRQIIWSVLAEASSNFEYLSDLERFFSELGWREFAYYQMYHLPHTINESMDSRFDEAGWLNPDDNPELLERWQQGRTGIPIVDAGMRELWHTGWMHNRVRMIVASLLTKNLGIHWLEGARWFWDTLVDADLACNTLGWQWTAGCGVDAAPYYRIFSPQRQTDRFDPLHSYIDQWIPEYGTANYPEPILDLGTTRKQALAHWEAIRSTEKAIA